MSNTTLKENIYNSIWDGIVNGEYDSNYIFNEKALVEKYKVSKSPVRDALIELCSDGILRSIPRYGYEIVKITNKDLQEIIRLRTIIEVDNLELLIGNVSNDKIQNIKKFMEETDISIATNRLTIKNHWQNNIQFHKLLYSLSNNNFGMVLLDRCLKAETVAYSTYCLYTIDTIDILNSKGHWDIINGIISGNKSKAIKALKDDLGAVKI
jgi:DNA-binding GntR family transcriptional regulator